MNDTEIRDKILSILYREYRKNPEVNMMGQDTLAAEIDVDTKVFEYNLNFLIRFGFVEVGQEFGSLSIDLKGIQKMEEASEYNPPSADHRNQIIEISGGTVGQVVQAQNITLDSSIFLDHLIQLIEKQPDLQLEEKKTWIETLKKWSNHPILVGLISKAFDLLIQKAYTR